MKNSSVIIFFLTAAIVSLLYFPRSLRRRPLKAVAGVITAAMAILWYPGSLLQRRIRIFVVAIQVFISYKLMQRRDKSIKDETHRNQVWEKTHELNASRVYKAIVKLEGLWVKAGQYLSTRTDVLPDPYVGSFRRLQDTLPPRPFHEVYETVESELKRPIREAFVDFDPAPLATASIAQVHRASLADGTAVVVKVQHKGVKHRILQDLANLQTIVEWVAWSEPQFNFKPVLDEWAAEVPKELDFVTEAENTRRVQRNLSGGNNNGGKGTAGDVLAHVDVVLPTIIQATEKVLVMTYMDGVRLNDLEGLDLIGAGRQSLVETITRAYAHQIYVDGFFNADPHPGNFLVGKEPPHRPILLDFGLTKELRPNIQVALAKMLLAAAEGDMAMLLSSFTEMGLRLRTDMPEDAMAVTSFFFRKTTPSAEAKEEMRAHMKERVARAKAMAVAAEEEEEEDGGGNKSLRRNPVDAFPGELVFFSRVLQLLRGLSSSLGTRVAYLEVMRPFAEAVLSSAHVLADKPLLRGSGWEGFVRDSPILGDVDKKVRGLICQLAQQGKILGIQVCVYKGGQVAVDCAAGVLGRYDPRPVQANSLFSVYSATKGVAAALVHWLVDRRLVELSAPVATIWPAFAANGKESCTVAQVLTHRAGLQNALTEELLAHPDIVCDWKGMLTRIANSAPEGASVAPAGAERPEAYHFLTFGWLTGGIIEFASGKGFQDVLDEALTKPLGVEGEFYIGIPPGVEDRLATLCSDREEAGAWQAEILSSIMTGNAPDGRPVARSAQPSNGVAPRGGIDVAKSSASLPLLFNTLFIRRAVIPSANGHFSARALARLYAALARGGQIPSLPHSSSSPPLGSAARALKRKAWLLAKKEEERAKEQSKKRSWWERNTRRTHGAPKLAAVAAGLDDKGQAWEEGGGKNQGLRSLTLEKGAQTGRSSEHLEGQKLYSDPLITDAFVGGGAHAPLCHPQGQFGLGFKRYLPAGVSGADLGENCQAAFGHPGMGGSVAFCDPKHDFAVAITLNLLSSDVSVPASIINLVCSELGVPVPAAYSLPVA